MFGIGPLELVMILVVALLVFGPKRVPELARTLGKGLAEFRRASNDLRQSLALDDLQQDLRRNLTENQTIHRPTPPKPDAETQASQTEASEPGAEDKAEDPEPSAAHPGELPLDNDHEHHDEAEEDESPPVAAVTSPADPGLGNVPVADPNPSGRKRG